jgi:hypothetical protein
VAFERTTPSRRSSGIVRLASVIARVRELEARTGIARVRELEARAGWTNRDA